MNDFGWPLKPPNHPRYLNTEFVGHTYPTKTIDQVERLIASDPSRRLEGGLGFYPGTAAHPPFVHIDVRGTAARWQG